jgi:hypothetical protein
MNKTQLEIDNDLLIEELTKQCESKLKSYKVAKYNLKAARTALKMAQNLPTEKPKSELYIALESCYRVPVEGENPIWKQPKQILEDLLKVGKLKKSTLVEISDVKVGLALKALGYTRVSKKIDKISPRWGYLVIQLY